MVCNQLVEILSRLFQAKHEHDELLAPIRHLHKVVALELRLHVPMGIINPEVLSSIPPRRQLTHYPETPCSRNEEIDNGISLFAEPVELGFLFYMKVFRNAPKDGDGDKLPKAREEDDVVGKEEEIAPAFGVSGVTGVGCGDHV